MRQITTFIFVLALLVAPLGSEPQGGKLITITAGTAQRLVTTRTMANSMLIQPLHGGTGLVYVLNAPPNVTCANAGAGTVFIAELGPATATSPGGSLTYPSNNPATSSAGGFDVANFCIDGANSGDKVAVSWDIRN